MEEMENTENFCYFCTFPQRRSLSCRREKTKTSTMELEMETETKTRPSMSNGNSDISGIGGGDVVANAECTAHGLDMPDTFQSCGNEVCPHWTKGDWTLCQQSRCHGRNTAIQRRDVSCRYENGSLGNACDEYERPTGRQECYNERCKGVWRVEPWSEVGLNLHPCTLSPFHSYTLSPFSFPPSLCRNRTSSIAYFINGKCNSILFSDLFSFSQCNAPCGRQGIKFRILQCVWYGSRRPAGNVCKHQPRPAVMKVCKSPSCQSKCKSNKSPK